MAWGNGFKLSANIFSAALPVGYKEKKQIYSKSEIFHTWASGNVFRGRSLNVFFEDGIIYSYGRHFPMAKIHTNKRGEKLVLITNEKYSSTTAKHLYGVRDAVSHLPKLTVPNVSHGHAENVEYLETRAIDALDSLLRGRGGNVRECLLNLHHYASFFCVKINLPTLEMLEKKNGTVEIWRELEKQFLGAQELRRFKAKARAENAAKAFQEKHAATIAELNAAFPAALETWLAAPIAALEIKNMPGEDINCDDFISAAYERELMADNTLENAMQVKIDSGRRVFGKIPYGESRTVAVTLSSEQHATIKARLQERMAAEIELWKAGTINRIGGKYFYGTLYANMPAHDFIRVKGDRVETMRGAHVPLADAVKLYKRILSREAKQGERVGIYQFDSVSGENTKPRIVKIGCHTIDLDQAAQVLAPYLN